MEGPLAPPVPTALPIQMFCSRTSNNMIIKIHELALRLILNDYTGDFHKLLQNNDDTCNHYRDIQTLIVKIYKIKKVT